MQNKNQPIDAVIAWVDGNDPAHREKMEPFRARLANVVDNVSGDTRFRSVGEIFFCMASIIKFAPFVRQIFIVTDGQDPKLGDFIDANFPDNKIPVKIVDHKVIFRGYEEYLPVFNSLPIETCLFRIPDLSENYLYFNDDVFLCRPSSQEDFFVNDKIVLRGNWRNYAFDALVSRLKVMIKGRDTSFGFKDSLRNAAKVLGRRSRYFYMSHTAHPQIKSILAEYYASNPDVFRVNLEHKFRHYTQFNPQELCFLLASEQGKAVVSDKTEALYMKPVGTGKGYVEKKKAAYRDGNPLFLCIQSLDMAGEVDYRQIVEWLSEILCVKPPGQDMSL